MSYQKKYYFQFTDRTDRVHVVELWQNTEDVLTSEEIKSIPPGFNVEMPELTHKFQVIRGAGCQINLLSATDMKFFTGLYHVNPTDFKVLHYIDTVLNWCGYLNAEMMTEPYDINFNYQVSITGNDGFSLMDRFSFIQVDETNYTGIKSKFELLQIIFAKIGLPFVEYRIALATTFTGYSAAANSTILHESYMDCANFYDEDNKPMSLREVVESILKPYGAYIRAEGANIYITDIHTKASNSTVTYKRFTISSGAYVADIAILNEKAIGTVGYIGTGTNIERSGGVNRQVVSYSPYPVKTILEKSLVNLDEFTTVPGSWSTKGTSTPYYNYKTIETNDFWDIDFAKTIVLDPSTFEISYYPLEKDANIYMRFPRYGGLNARCFYLKYVKYLNISGATVNPLSGNPDRPIRRRTKYYDGVAFRITGQILIKTKDNPYDDAQTSKQIVRMALSCRIKVGSMYFNQSINGWDATPQNFDLWTSDQQGEVIADSFVQIGENGKGLQIIVGNVTTEIVLSGDLEFEIWSEYQTILKDGTVTPVVNSTDVDEIWIKEVGFELVNFDGSEIQDNDIEYIGLLDKTYQNEGEKIALTAGTDTQFADRGKILKYDGSVYTDIKVWTRNSQSFKIEELLLGSVSSNYRAGFITLSNMRLNNSVLLQNIFTDTFIGSAKMMVKSAVINYYDNVFECSLVEILPDELIIVKDATVS